MPAQRTAASRRSAGTTTARSSRPASAEPAPAKAKSKAAAKVNANANANAREIRRFWLSYPTKLITKPVIWEMSQKFPVVFNVRQASVSDEIGILCLELAAPRADLKAAISWLEKQGVKVEPVEINVIES